MMTMLLLAVMGSAWGDSYTLGWGAATGDEGTYTNFTAVSGTVTNIVSFSTAKNSSTSNPAYNSNSSELRLYYNSGGAGGSITLTPAEGVTITGFVMTTSTSPSVIYKVDGGTATSVSSSSNTYTVSDISATTSLEIQNANTTNTQLRIKTIQITYTVTSAYTITAQSNNTSYGTVSLNGSVITGSPNVGYRYADPAYTVSPTNSATVTQNGNDFTVTPSDNTTVTINFEPIPTHTATFSVNGSTTTQNLVEGAAITFPDNPVDIQGKTFVGWIETTIDGTTNEAPTFVTSATMGNSDVTYYAVFADVTDNGSGAYTLDYGQETNLSSSTEWGSYGTVYNYTATDGNIWVVKAYKNQGMQINTGKDCSIKIPDCPGNITSISITCSAAKAVGFSGNDYIGSGTITYLAEGSNATSQTLDLDGKNVTGGYIVPKSGSTSITKIVVNYSGVTYSDYCTTVVAVAVERPVITVADNPFLFSTTATITCETEGAVIKYSYDGENWIDYIDVLTITETKTIYAKAIKGEDESTVAQVTATKNLATPTVTVSGDLTIDLEGETNVSAGTLTAAVTYNDAAVEGATVTWSSSNTDIATIDASTGAVTIIATGEVTFTATYVGNSDYADATGTKTVTVTDSKAPGTENNPYTVAQARAAIDAGTGVTGVYATGIVTAIPTAWSSQYNNITFTFVDNSGDTDVLQAYRCVSTDNADASTVAVGDIVVVYGNLTKYGDAYEFYNPCQLVSLRHPSAITFDPESSEQDGTYTVNITSESGTIYYIEQTKMIYLDLETGYPTETNTGVLNPAAVVYSGTLTYSQPMMVTAVTVDANGNISDATTAIYTYTGAVTPPYYETFSDYSGGFTAEKETNGPEWRIQSNTGQQAIANWGEERHYEYVSGSSANTYANNIERYYGTADLISPIINLNGVTDPSFFFIHAGHKFYSDPNTTATQNTGLETTLDDEVAKVSCKVYVGISDVSGNVTTWNQIPWGEGGATFFTQKFRANDYTNADCTVTSSTDSRSGQFIRVNSGEISLDAYKNNYIRIKFEYTSDSEHYGTWNVDKFQVNASKTEKIEMNAKGWTTYVIDHDIDAYQTTLNIGGLQIFKVTEFDNTTAVLQQLGIVENHDSDVDDSERYLPAKTPIVVHGPAGQEIDFVIYQSPEVLPKVKNNLLYASLDPNLAKATSGVRYFVLQMKENADLPYFNKLKEGRAVPDHKAYLNGEQQVEAITSQTNAARGLFVMRDLTNGDSVVSEDGGFVDGIESIDEDTGNAVWHSISGVRVNHPTKGIYIVNGKKVIIK